MNSQEVQNALIDELDAIIRHLSSFHPDLVEFRQFLGIKLDESITNLVEENN